MIIDYIKSELHEFYEFLSKRNVVNTGISLIIALQINSLFLDFIEDVVKPIATKTVSEDIDSHYIKLFGIKFKVGHLIVSIINFIIITIFLYYIYRISSNTPGFFSRVYHGIRGGIKSIIPILPINE